MIIDPLDISRLRSMSPGMMQPEGLVFLILTYREDLIKHLADNKCLFNYINDDIIYPIVEPHFKTNAHYIYGESLDFNKNKNYLTAGICIRSDTDFDVKTLTTNMVTLIRMIDQSIVKLKFSKNLFIHDHLQDNKTLFRSFDDRLMVHVMFEYLKEFI